MFFNNLRRTVFRRFRWLGLVRSPFKVRKRHKLQLVVILMSLNILISLSILNQQSKLTSIFDKYFTSFRYKCDNSELLNLLNIYRNMFKWNDRLNLTKAHHSPYAHLNRAFNARHSLNLVPAGIYFFSYFYTYIFIMFTSYENNNYFYNTKKSYFSKFRAFLNQIFKRLKLWRM